MEPSRATSGQEKAKAGLQDLNTTDLLRAQTQVLHYAYRFFGDMSIKCALDLGIFDAVDSLGGGPFTLSELTAVLTELHPTKTIVLPRLIRMLTQLGFFAKQTLSAAGNKGAAYLLTPTGKLLVKSNPTSSADIFRFQYHPLCRQSVLQFGDWMRGPASTKLEETNGKPLWQFLKEDPNFNTLFNNAMASDSSSVVQAIIRDCRDVFEGVVTLVDVGGGTGATAAVIAEAFPELKCTVLDLPHVVAEAVPERIGGIAMVAGDMFQHIPPADAIFLKSVLHDWNDDDCVRILKRCKEAIPSDVGKVIVVDMVIGSDNSDKELVEAQLFSDICMVLAFNSFERDEEEWGNIFQRAGFGSFKIKHALGLRSLIEIYP